MSHRLLIVTTDTMTLRAFLVPYGEFFRSLGWHVDAAATQTSSYPTIRDSFNGVYEVRWRRSPFTPASLRGLRDIRRLIRGGRYDIVHVHTPVASFITRIAVMGLPADQRPHVVYTAHGFHFHRGSRGVSSAFFRLAERAAASGTDRLIVINREDHEAAVRLKLVDEEHLVLMPGIGVDTSAWRRVGVDSSRSREIRAATGIPDDVSVIVTVAELNPGKRHRDLLSAVAESSDTSFHVVFVGRGPLEAQLRDQAAALGIADRVHLVGFTEDVVDLLGIASVMVLPSEREGLPVSIIEAMCMEVPVIAADVRGSRDLLADGAGVLYPVGDVGALSSAIDRVLSDDVFARELSEAARGRVERYDIAPLLAAHRSMYESLVTEGDA